MSRDVGVGQLVDELEQRGDRLPFEIGAFVALEACEGLLQESVKLDADDVRVTLDGAVLVADSAKHAEPDEAARSLASVLGRLLVAAGPGVPPQLLQLVKDSATGQNPRDLRHLHDTIEASLIPINRGASRRVLARLVRESDRPPPPEQVPHVDPYELDAELDELLRDPSLRTLGPSDVAVAEEDPEIEEPITERIRIPRPVAEETELDLQPATVPVPPSEPARKRSSVSIPDLRSPSPADASSAAAPARRPTSQRAPDPITATIRKWQPADETGPEPKHGSLESTAESVAQSVYVSVSESANVRPGSAGLETASESVFATGTVTTPPRPDAVSAPPPNRESLPSESPKDRPSAPALPRRRGGWGIWLLAAALGLGAYALIASGAVDTLLQPAAPAPTEAAPGIVDVAVTPDDAQIFVFVGRGPAMAAGLREGGAHEFVVFDRGLAPARASVPEGAAWSSGEGGALYELAVQAQPDASAQGLGDLGQPSSTPQAGGTTDQGTVRIVTNPPGAKVYRFVSTGPTAQLRVSSIHEGQELLIYRSGFESRREVIGPSDWKAPAEEGSAHRASLEIDLSAVPTSEVPEPLED